MQKTEIHIDAVKAGDTILHNGVLTTVCKTDIRISTFMGCTIFGDSYALGSKPVIKVNLVLS